ncbi:MAG: hypothetical protein IKD55_07325 [Sediminibacterium sp.]|nr:hypothetical protein [Sediminibacterium sp.]MBX9780494.1 hypothetical protein [Chitinophagaceae bacterium]
MPFFKRIHKKNRLPLISNWLIIFVSFFISCKKTNNISPISSSIFFFPQKAAAYDVIKIGGKNFTGTTAVSFGGINALSFKILNDSIIFAKLDSVAKSGNLVIQTPNGVFSVPGFTYYEPRFFKLRGSMVYYLDSSFNYPSNGPLYTASNKTLLDTSSIAIYELNKYDFKRNDPYSTATNNYADTQLVKYPLFNDSANYFRISGLHNASPPVYPNIYCCASNFISLYYTSPNLSQNYSPVFYAKFLADSSIVIPDQMVNVSMQRSFKGSGFIKNGVITLAIYSSYGVFHQTGNWVSQ